MSRNGWVARVALLWAGVVLGCSFIATPAKFQAPSLSLATALEVGRVTFRSLAIAEVALAVVGCALLLRFGPRRSWFWIAIGVLIVQWTVVMPLLNAQTNTVIQGGVRSGPPWHVVYIALEAVKVVTLFIVALQASPVQASPA